MNIVCVWFRNVWIMVFHQKPPCTTLYLVALSKENYINETTEQNANVTASIVLFPFTNIHFNCFNTSSNTNRSSSNLTSFFRAFYLFTICFPCCNPNSIDILVIIISHKSYHVSRIHIYVYDVQIDTYLMYDELGFYWICECF